MVLMRQTRLEKRTYNFGVCTSSLHQVRFYSRIQWSKSRVSGDGACSVTCFCKIRTNYPFSWVEWQSQHARQTLFAPLRPYGVHIVYLCWHSALFIYTHTSDSHPCDAHIHSPTFTHSPLQQYSVQTPTLYINRTQRVWIHWHAFEPFFIFSYNIVEHRPFYLKTMLSLASFLWLLRSDGRA